MFTQKKESNCSHKQRKERLMKYMLDINLTTRRHVLLVKERTRQRKSAVALLSSASKNPGARKKRQKADSIDKELYIWSNVVRLLAFFFLVSVLVEASDTYIYDDKVVVGKAC